MADEQNQKCRGLFDDLAHMEANKAWLDEWPVGGGRPTHDDRAALVRMVRCLVGMLPSSVTNDVVEAAWSEAKRLSRSPHV